ncbi:MAG: 2-hydroxychromene-2-carboxylate isomerase [Paracoccus denitrificans]|nr:MAG: 2-hydroxychromene-2-carboxylate isomerase [Paracoccus denitrificans]PZO84652.1 MAG: 2-hydroxychromene-2-carboxylate isomerase [Paracoccus denitrificans]
MAHIDYYFGTTSPYVYLAGNRLEEIAAKHGAAITYRPVDIPQLFDRTGGIQPASRHSSRMEYRAQELARWSEELGMPLKIDVAATNAAPSSYAVIAAQETGGDVAPLIQAITRARWAEGRDIADDAVIREALSATGFDPSLVDKGLFVGAETYARNLECAVEAGVFGAPFYIVTDSGQKFWGQDRLSFLDKHLASL